MNAPPVLRSGGRRWSMFMFVASLLAVVIGLAAYTEVRMDQRDHEWCELLEAVDRTPPPGTTLTAEQLRAVRAIRDLRARKGCG